MLGFMTRGELPEDETLARQITRRSKSMMIINGELLIAVLQGLFSIASLLKKAKKFYVRFMKGIAVITPGQNLLWLRLFVMGFIG